MKAVYVRDKAMDWGLDLAKILGSLDERGLRPVSWKVDDNFIHLEFADE